MTNLEFLLSRYLDGDLTGPELRELRAQLRDVPESRAILGGFQAIRRAARHGMPVAPMAELERDLFRKLRAEGFRGTIRQESSPESVSEVPVRKSWQETSRTAWRRTLQVAVSAALLFFVIGTERMFVGSDSSKTATRPAISSLSGLSVQSRRVPDQLGSQSGHFTRRVPPARRLVRYGTGNPGSSSSPALATPQQLLSPTPALADKNAQPEHPGDAERVSTDRRIEKIAPLISPVVLPGEMAVNTIEEGQGRFSISICPGYSRLGNEAGSVASESSVRLTARIGSFGTISAIVGSGASLVETRRLSTGRYLSVASMGPGGGPPNRDLSSLPPIVPYESSLSSETWIGLGYSYGVRIPSTKLEIGIAATAGRGANNWRVGMELPVSYHLSGQIELEAAATATQIIPRDGSLSIFPQLSRDGEIYQGETGRPLFTELGARLGIKVAVR